MCYRLVIMASNTQLGRLNLHFPLTQDITETYFWVSLSHHLAQCWETTATSYTLAYWQHHYRNFHFLYFFSLGLIHSTASWYTVSTFTWFHTCHDASLSSLLSLQPSSITTLPFQAKELTCSTNPFTNSSQCIKLTGLVHFRTLVTLQRVRVSVRLGLELVRFRIRVRVRLG